LTMIFYKDFNEFYNMIPLENLSIHKAANVAFTNYLNHNQLTNR
jgi:hypothetical protein